MVAADDFNDTVSKVLSNAFPKGYAAFYCMKYEVTQGQWVDFFNTLTDAQKATRDITSSTGKNSDGVVSRNTVAWTTGDATSTRRDRACNFLSWADGCAFADWAGLRPMTELEFEKACRGPLTPVADEFAWGTATIMANASRTISGTENGTETITSDTSLGGCNYGNLAHTGGDAGSGPLRAGIFATNGSSRVSAGASYWGIMELSGNLWERPVMVGNATGRTFTGLHGNGVLDVSTGDADVTGWPGTTATGAGFRGGGWWAAGVYVRASDRFYGPYVVATRSEDIGSRSVRVAPSGVGP
jgi:formylglycine-generating enzyme required for sulfatase activity